MTSEQFQGRSFPDLRSITNKFVVQRPRLAQDAIQPAINLLRVKFNDKNSVYDEKLIKAYFKQASQDQSEPEAAKFFSNVCEEMEHLGDGESVGQLLEALDTQLRASLFEVQRKNSNSNGWDH